jgi:hypothetical protein
MFQFRWFPPRAYFIQRAVNGYCPPGFPHSEICGLYACLRLPAAFRSLPRPSSAPGAKAFALRPSSLDRLPYARLILLPTVIFLTSAYCSLLLPDYVFLIIVSRSFFLLFNVQFSRCMRSPAWRGTWWAQMDSNHRPRAYQARALTT